MLKISVNHIKANEGSYLYLYPFKDIAQKSFQRGFYVCIDFLKTFLIENQLRIKWKLIGI